MRSTPSGRKDAPLSCETTQGLLAELALGVLTGRERAGAIEHVEECPRCRLSLRELASAADALLALAPEADPGPDLEVRVLDRLRRAEHLPPRRLSHWWRVAVLGVRSRLPDCPRLWVWFSAAKRSRLGWAMRLPPGHGSSTRYSEKVRPSVERCRSSLIGRTGFSWPSGMLGSPPASNAR